MENSIYVGLSRQVALARQMDIVSNNIANMSTPGYRSHNMVFAEHIEKLKGNPDPLSMVNDYGMYQNTESGPLKNTGNPLDVAIAGKGYFTIETAEGPMYTRAGNFQVDLNGQLVDTRGRTVAANGGGGVLIPAGAKHIEIAENGTVFTDQGEAGTLAIVEFENVQYLEPQGNGLYATEAPALPAENSLVRQGMLEGSNVNPILEMTRMIDVSRNYTSNMKLIHNEHERQRTMVQRLTQR
jgi:flagellar basal-body rod protein FlgF